MDFIRPTPSKTSVSVAQKLQEDRGGAFSDYFLPLIGRVLCYDEGMKQILFLGLAALSAHAQFSADDMMKSAIYTNRAGVAQAYRIAVPQFPQPGRKYPLILFLHGSGECGTDNLKQIKVGLPNLITTLLKRSKPEPVMIVAPQCQTNNWFVKSLAFTEEYSMPQQSAPALAEAIELVKYLVAERQADPDRLYITGLSLGGFATWDAVQREPELFAAAVPICGGGDTKLAPVLKRLPIWVFHGTADKSVPVDCSRRMVRALKQCGNRTTNYTEYENVGHDVWTRAYNTPEMVEWMLAQTRAKKPWWKFWQR